MKHRFDGWYMTETTDRYQKQVDELAQQTLAEMARVGSQPLLVIGAQTALDHVGVDVPGFVELRRTFDLQVVFLAQGCPFWMVAVVATKGDRQAFASVGSHTDMKKALRRALRELAAKAEVLDAETAGQKLVSRWMPGWLYRLKKISWRDLSELEEYAHTDLSNFYYPANLPVRPAGVGLWWIYKQAYETMTQSKKETA